jgi:RNA polymerase sigma-70 factor (ECF subfamily)
LTSLAYRTLGSLAEAEDAVQETWLRFARTDLAEIREPAAWLTTVLSRVCLDVLRSARVRHEAYVGSWLPEPLVSRIAANPSSESTDPAEIAARGEEVSTAMLMVLERLGPEQRVAFVLHDVFAVPYDEVASILATTPAAARQLASRARRAVTDSGVSRRRAAPTEQRQAVEAFLAAARSGDLDALLAVLAPDVVFIGDGGGLAPASPRPIEGALAAARFVLGLFRRAEADMVLDLEPVLVNGDLGLVIEAIAAPGGRLPAPAGAHLDLLRLVLSFTVVDGRITAILNQLNPTKLTHVPTLAELRE